MWLNKAKRQKHIYIMLLAFAGIACIIAYPIINRGAGALRDAQSTYFKKNFAAAIPYFEKAIAEGSTNPTAYIHLAYSYTAEGDFNQAATWFRAYLKMKPRDIEARLALARALSWAKKYDEAEIEYKELLKEQQ
jgi:tetratricopeptide (TPR) repeat protein